MKEKSITWYLKKAGKKGLLLNNLFQLDNGTYQANFRGKTEDNSIFTSFGLGNSPQKALSNALKDKGSFSNPTTTFRKRPRLPKGLL